MRTFDPFGHRYDTRKSELGASMVFDYIKINDAFSYVRVWPFSFLTTSWQKIYKNRLFISIRNGECVREREKEIESEMEGRKTIIYCTHKYFPFWFSRSTIYFFLLSLNRISAGVTSIPYECIKYIYYFFPILWNNESVNWSTFSPQLHRFFPNKM